MNRNESAFRLTVACVALWLVNGSVIAQTPSSAATVDVTRFEVQGNTLLPPELIASELERFKGPRTFEELERAAASVQRLYARQGYGAVVAFLPPQTPADGSVEITVVEGRLSRVDVRGAERSGEDNVRASLPALELGTTPNLRQIDRQVLLANENPAKRTEVLLQPGANSGEVEAVVAVSARAPQRWTLLADNLGDDQTGRGRVGVTWQHANVSGRDDVLTLQALTALEQPADSFVVGAGYRWPWYRANTVVDLFAAYSDSDGSSVSTPAGRLDFSGGGRLYGVRATHVLPRWGEADQRLVAGLDHRTYLNECAVAGLPEEACGAAGESVTVQPLTLGYSAGQGGALAWSLAAEAQHNLQVGGGYNDDADFEAVRPGADPRYTLGRLTGFVTVTFEEGWQVRLRGAGQWTNDALVPSEQYGIGGFYSVRGYRERELLGDRGAFGSIEVGTPALGKDSLPGGLRLALFADAGTVQSLDGLQCLPAQSRCTLASTGVAAEIGNAEFLLRMSAGLALRDGAVTEDGSVRANFAVSYSF